MKNIFAYLIIFSLFISCSRKITSQLEKTNERVHLSQPDRALIKNRPLPDSLVKQAVHIDQNGTSYSLIENQVMNNGESMGVVNLQGITVTSNSKNVPERVGKVSLDFMVTVPESLISNRWQLQLTPVLYKKDTSDELEKILLSGADFLKKQKKGYARYQAFINSIIPDDEYLQRLFDEKGYRKAIAGLEEEFYQAWKRDLLLEQEYIDWSDKMNQRYLVFNNKVLKKKAQDKTKKTIFSVLPQYWMIREIDEETTPDQYKKHLDKNYAVVKKTITPEDSAKISKRYYDIKRVMDNEKKKSLVDNKYNEYVKLPLEASRLDTVINSNGSFKYYYVQEVALEDDSKKYHLVLNSKVLGTDSSTYELPVSDTITYFISSALQFLDYTPRYKMKVINKRVEMDLKSYIAFDAGKSTINLNMSDNGTEFAKIKETIDSLAFSKELDIDSIVMTASSSPDGGFDLNYNLSKDRVISLKQFIVDNVCVDSHENLKSKFREAWLGEDWNRLSNKIENSEALKNKSDILDLIENESDADVRESKIRNYKSDYSYIQKYFYPELRIVTFKFNLSRSDMKKDTIHTNFLDDYYQRGVDLLSKRKYNEALVILSDYEDFNTAICLMSLGYDSKAYEILLKTPDNANRNYLQAIVCIRLKRYKEALHYYEKSCEQDSTKIWRGRLDPEIYELTKLYNIPNS
jgi:hypothetical protein